jgi:hypothetical protein
MMEAPISGTSETFMYRELMFINSFESILFNYNLDGTMSRAPGFQSVKLLCLNSESAMQIVAESVIREGTSHDCNLL